MIAFLDVAYGSRGARAACVLASSWTDPAPSSAHHVDLPSVAAYEPGHFYRRELPCLLAVLQTLPARPDIAVVDGYVWLSDTGRPGLGFHLYHALGATIPVVGVAKTAFAGADESAQVIQVYRGESRRPLFVTAIGVDVTHARVWVEQMAGAYRIPNLLTAADLLSRSARGSHAFNLEPSDGGRSLP